MKVPEQEEYFGRMNSPTASALVKGACGDEMEFYLVIDDGVIIDLGAVVCHDNYIGKFSHLSPGCSLSGTIKLKENVLVGVGACINSTVTIGRNVIITPGSAVMNDLPDQVIVSGVPAQVVGQSKRGK